MIADRHFVSHQQHQAQHAYHRKPRPIGEYGLLADAMARDEYVSYGVWTFGMGVRWDGPVLVTLGAGLALGSSTRITGSYDVESTSMSGVTALAHGILPLATVGHAKVGAAVFSSADAKEGPRAFLEKRAPQFQGR